MSVFSSAYEALVWGTYYLIEFVANIFVIIYVAHRMGWIGGPRSRQEVQEAPVSNVQQTSNLVAGVTDLLKTAKGAWTEVASTPQAAAPNGSTPQHQPVYQQGTKK
jgi:hypothetical protein